MDDIVPGLLNQMKSDFQKQYDDNSKIQELNEKLNTGTATYHEANEYAAEVGKITKKTYEKNISSEMLPDGKMYYNIADRVIGNTEHDQYELVSEYTEQVQTDLNKKAGIGLKAQVPEEDIDRVEGLVNYASNADSYDDIAEGLIQGLESMALETVNKYVEKNADFQYKSGFQPKIVRNGGDCCEWCSQLLGRYDYPNVPDDVYRRHNNCTCTVEYDPGDGKRLQNVWNHNQWREAIDEETLQNRKIVGLDNGDNSDKIQYRKEIESKRFYVPKDVGAAFRKFYVKKPLYLRGGKIYIKPGTEVTGVKVILEGNEINDVKYLIEKYPLPNGEKTKASDWYKVRGRAHVTDGENYNDVREVHWYQCKNIGKVDFKFPNNKKQR